MSGPGAPRWRLLDTGLLPAAQNMALDSAMLSARNDGVTVNTLRFLEFSPRCALVGCNQSVELEIDEEYCREHGIQVNRRITGGGAIFLDERQLGWELYAARSDFASAGLARMFECVGACVVASLAKLGVHAAFRPKNDIEVDGRKISGCGGTELDSALLYHGTLLVDFDVETMLGCLRLPVRKLDDKQIAGFRERVTCLREILGEAPPMPAVKEAVSEGFAEVLGVHLEAGGLTDTERDRYGDALDSFAGEEWIRGRGVSWQGSEMGSVDRKTPGGLLRVAVQIDPRRAVLKTAFITGDFFVLPQRFILDLEASLKSCPLDDIDRRVRGGFLESDVQMPGVTAADVSDALHVAIAAAMDTDQDRSLEAR